MTLSSLRSAAKKIKIALPRKGRLRAPAVELFKKAGYQFKSEKNLLFSTDQAQGVDFFFLRAEDIPLLIQNQALDLGVTGVDLVKERAAPLEKILALNFGACRICLAGPAAYPSLNAFLQAAPHRPLRIATSFPQLTAEFFKARQMEVRCLQLNGAVEIMVRLGLCDLIVDVVETGETLAQNELVVWETLLHSEAALYAHSASSQAQATFLLKLKKRLRGILLAAQYSVLEYNIPRKYLSQAQKITPGFDAPTVSQLDDPALVAVKVMLQKKRVVEVMEQLEQLGATGIFEVEVTNCRL